MSIINDKYCKLITVNKSDLRAFSSLNTFMLHVPFEGKEAWHAPLHIQLFPCEPQKRI